MTDARPSRPVVAFLIDGRRYPAINFRKANVMHLIELKAQTRKLGLGPDGRGFTMDLLEKAIGDKDFSAEWAEELFVASLFLCRRSAGEDVSFAGAAVYDTIDAEFEDQGDAEEEPGPTVPGGPATPEPPGDLDVTDSNGNSTT